MRSIVSGHFRNAMRTARNGVGDELNTESTCDEGKELPAASGELTGIDALTGGAGGYADGMGRGVFG